MSFITRPSAEVQVRLPGYWRMLKLTESVCVPEAEPDEMFHWGLVCCSSCDEILCDIIYVLWSVLPGAKSHVADNFVVRQLRQGDLMLLLAYFANFLACRYVCLEHPRKCSELQ
jgi:hypothetical protein